MLLFVLVWVLNQLKASTGHQTMLSEERQHYSNETILTFGLFASNRPVESPISKEFLVLVFGGESERDRSETGSD